MNMVATVSTMVLYSASGMEKYVKQFDCRFEEV